MKEFLTKWQTLVSDYEVDIRERIFCKIASVGAVVAFLAFVETLIVSGGWIMSAALGILFFTLAASVYLTVQLHKMDLAGGILTLVLAFVIMPTLFFTNGGIEGGATIWFIITIVVTFLVFRGMKAHIFLTIDIVSEMAWYWLGFTHPEWITSFNSKQDIYLDSMFSVITVGIAVAMMIRFHIRTYEEQRKTVEWQKQELEKNSESQTHFFASMSHELRTPINTIIGLNEMLLRESNEEMTIDYSRKIQSSSKMLLSLINDILDLSQLETQKMVIAENDYSTVTLFSDLIDMVSTLCAEKNLEFQVDIDDSIPRILYGDRKRIQQVLLNILANAVKYTPQGTVSFSIRVEKLEEKEVTLRFSVRDTGVGIKKEHLANLYQVFKRIDLVNNEKVEGSGLGLSITKQLLTLMGGTITIDSIYTKGSEFTVTLTQQIVENEGIGNILEIMNLRNRSKEKHEHLFEASQARILVVDDNPTNGMIVQKMLEKTGMQIDLATSGEECLQLTKNKYYHLILMDDRMPGMDGTETLQKVRNQSNGLCKEVPILALTANSISSAEQYYQENGFQGYLEKPIPIAVLEKVVLSYLPENIVEYVRDEADYAHVEAVQVSSVKRKKKVRVTTDCVAEISDDLMKEYDMGMICLYIETPEGRFADTIEIDIGNLNQYITMEGSRARAVSISLEEYEEFFAEQLMVAEDVVHISMSKGCGKSYGVAVAAAESFDHVHVVDSGHISGGERMLALYAAKLAKEGASVEEIIEKVEKASERIVTKFMMPSARMFYQSGYTTYPVYRLCDLLGLHPVLTIKKGVLRVTGFTLGDISAAMRGFVKSTIGNPKWIQNKDVFVSQVALNAKEKELLLDTVQKCIGEGKIHYRKASLSCACNAGLGAVGISFYNTRGKQQELLKDE